MKLNFYLLYTFIIIVLAIAVSSHYIQCHNKKDINNNEYKNEDRKTLSIVTILFSILLLIVTCVVAYYNNSSTTTYKSYFFHFDHNHEYLFYYLLFAGIVTILSFVTTSTLIDCYRMNQVDDQWGLSSANMVLTFIFFFVSIYLFMKPPKLEDIKTETQIKDLDVVKQEIAFLDTAAANVYKASVAATA